MVTSEQKKRIKAVFAFLFIVYLVVLVYLLFFFEMRAGMAASAETHMNLRIFHEIHRYIAYRRQLGARNVFLNLAGNILLFVPFGFFAPMLFRRLRGFFRILLASMGLSACVEITQLITHLGCCDVDDVILNTIGGMLGAMCCGIILFLNRRAEQKKYRRKKHR